MERSVVDYACMCVCVCVCVCGCVVGLTGFFCVSLLPIFIWSHRTGGGSQAPNIEPTPSFSACLSSHPPPGVCLVLHGLSTVASDPSRPESQGECFVTAWQAGSPRHPCPTSISLCHWWGISLARPYCNCTAAQVRKDAGVSQPAWPSRMLSLGT